MLSNTDGKEERKEEGERVERWDGHTHRRRRG
jgi:hypothetical protein